MYLKYKWNVIESRPELNYVNKNSQLMCPYDPQSVYSLEQYKRN